MWGKITPMNSARGDDAPVLSLYIYLEPHSNYVCQILNRMKELSSTYGHLKMQNFARYCSSASSGVVERDYLKNQEEPQKNNHAVWVFVAVSSAVTTFLGPWRKRDLEKNSDLGKIVKTQIWEKILGTPKSGEKR